MTISKMQLPGLITILVLIFSIIPFSLSDNLTSPVPPDQACSVTTNPTFCRSILPSGGRLNLFEYGRLLVSRSLQQSASFSGLIDRALKDNPNTLPGQAHGALQDCQLLSQITSNHLGSSLSTLNGAGSPFLPLRLGDDVHTLLSGIVANQQTCHDGLGQSSALHSMGDLYDQLVHGSELYRTSLAVFAHSWVPEGNNTKKVVQGRHLLEQSRVRPDGVPRWVNEDLLRFGPTRRSAHLFIPWVKTTVVVSKSGEADFRTINDAIAAAADNVDARIGYYMIQIDPGVYEEYVTVGSSKTNIMMVGAGINETIITGSHSVGDGFTTFNSATLVVVGQNFVGKDFTVRNTAGPAKGQAVAVRNGADLSSFYRCSFEGYQDTLYTHSMRQFYRECDIYGTVDFIFGDAAAVFQMCNMYARLPLKGQSITFTAQGRSDPNENTGISIMKSNIMATPELQEAGFPVQSYLGRPWREYSRTVYMRSNLDSLIDPKGWLPWSGDFALSTLYYGEYMNSGEGADTSQRVDWPGYHVMNFFDANSFTVSRMIQGEFWLLPTCVPFEAWIL
ncbi:pectinesterase-like [Nymphaea colorata]|nr:pectinesterase-like [Nymphaea colorata]